MENKITVSYFKCDTRQGSELFRRTKNMLEAMEIQGRRVEVLLRKNDPFVATEAYLCDDVVIFDGSLEDEDENCAGQQYDAMIEPMKTAKHVLIVSRSQIPFNVFGIRKGGYPRYIRTGVTEYRETFYNGEILEWINGLFTREGINLFNSRKLDRTYYQDLPGQEKNKVLNAKIKENVDEAREENEDGAYIFVSYLSRYSRYFPGKKAGNDEYTVEDLIQYISGSENIPTEKIGYFPPGNLSRELMTLQRRWEIVSVTDDFLRQCRQFWILAAPGYSTSWWTLSERVALAYLLANEPERCPDIYVAKFDEYNHSFRVEKYLDEEAKKKFLPRLGDDMVKELARYFINSRPDGVGYENVWIMRLQHHLPETAIRFISQNTYRKIGQMMPEMLEDLGETAEEFEEAAVQAAKSDVYTKSFWEDWVMECPHCKAESSQKRYHRKTFLHPEKSGFCHIVKKQDFSYDAEKKLYRISCKACGYQFYFKAGFLYRWYPIRGMGIHTGPGGKSIEKKTAFYFVDEE